MFLDHVIGSDASFAELEFTKLQYDLPRPDLLGYVVLIHEKQTYRLCSLFDLVIYADSARCDERRYDVIHNVILFVLTDLVENISRPLGQSSFL